jgi:hypothetical protein
MGGTCSMNGEDEKCIKKCRSKTSGEETTYRT